jgi:AcrR family transcriptional regulator
MSANSAVQAREETDGRRQRSEASRERIVSAMLELVGAGNMSPGAEEVAAQAKVGLRTVFRHFENMESLYQQINAAIVAEVLPMMTRPFSGTDWKSQLAEMTDRRVRIFERVMPFKIAGDIHKHKSAFLAGQSAELNRMQRELLTAILPREKREDAAFFESLDLLLSFDTWRRLRKDQKLSPARARQILDHMLHGLLRAK